MIFLGDLACPHEKVNAFSECVGRLSALNDQTVILNFEGVLLSEDDSIKKESLYNSIKVISTFKNTKKCIVSLANNHMYDYPEKIIETQTILHDNGIDSFGLSDDRGNIKPYEYLDSDGKEYALFGHCWHLYSRTNPNKINAVRVVDCDYPSFCIAVKDYIKKNPQKRTVCFMHWNYDLEKLPFPMLIQLSRELIDAGAFAVIGNHCHRTQGAEIYKGRLIAYCLGNFYIPSGVFFDGKLTYPDYSKESLGIEINDDAIYSLWFESDDDKDAVSFRNKNLVTEDKKLSRLLPKRADSIEEYTRFFKKNREKRFFVPVFDDYRENKKENIAFLRIKAIKTIQGLAARLGKE